MPKLSPCARNMIKILMHGVVAILSRVHLHTHTELQPMQLGYPYPAEPTFSAK